MLCSLVIAAFLSCSLQDDGQTKALFDEDLNPKCIHLSRDGKILAISGGTQKGGDWKIFDLAESKCLLNGMDGKLRCWGAWSVSLSHDNTLIAVGGNRMFFIANAKTGELVWDLTNGGHVSVAQGLFFTPDRKYLISTASVTIRVWDIENKKPHAAFRFTSTNPRLNRWQDPSFKEPAKLVYNIEGKYNFIGRCSLSPDGKVLAIAGDLESKVRVLDLATGKIVRTIHIKQPAANLTQFTADGKWLVIGSCQLNGQKGTVEIWDLEKNDLVTSFGRHEGPIGQLAISPDKKTVITGSDGFRVWDVATSKQKFSYFTKDDPRMPRIKVFDDGSKYVGKECPAAGVAFLPDGKTFLIVPHWTSITAEVYFHDTATGEPVDYRKRVAALPKIGDAPR